MIYIASHDLVSMIPGPTAKEGLLITRPVLFYSHINLHTCMPICLVCVVFQSLWYEKNNALVHPVTSWPEFFHPTCSVSQSSVCMCVCVCLYYLFACVSIFVWGKCTELTFYLTVTTVVTIALYI